MPDFIAYRFANWDTPLWVSPNRRSGRFNNPESPSTQYLSLHPLAPMAEYLRREGYVDLERLLELRARIWVLQVKEPRVEAVSFDTAVEFGLEPGDLVADDYGSCQMFADRCRNETDMPRAIRVPSAALPGTENVVIFGSRVIAPYDSMHIDQIDVPGSIVAEGAHPLHTLLARTRYIGDAHPHLEAWKQGLEWTYEEPGKELLSTTPL